MLDTPNAITVETFIFAPVEKIWKCWTIPEDIQNWCHASDDWHVPFATNDLRVGGKFVTRMEAKDGAMGFDFEGTYTVVEEYKTIAYVMGDGRKVEIEFIAQEDGFRVRETFDPESENTADMQKSGWQSILDNFKKYVDEK